MSEPTIVDRATWQAERDALLVREKAHTRAGDAIAAARRRLSMGWDVPWYSARDSGDGLLAGRGFAMLACYLRRGDRVFETHWTTGRGFEVMAPSYGLLDMTVHRRQETWEDPPPGWPQRRDVDTQLLRTDGRPTAQWSRLVGASS